MLLDMYRRLGTASVLTGFLVPAELLHAYGTSPMFTENLAATIAGAGHAQRALEHAERLGSAGTVVRFTGYIGGRPGGSVAEV